MSSFYKCEVFEYIDIVEIEACSHRYIYNESEIDGGFDYHSLIGGENIRYVLTGNKLYNKVKRITLEQATEIIRERANKSAT